MAGAEYTLKIILDAEDKASGTVRGLGKALEQARAGLNSIGGAIVAGLAGAAVAGFGALTAGLVSSTKAAMDAQAVQAQLNAVLASTGGKAGVTADMVNAISSEIQKLTRFGDDAVTSAQSVLLTFTNVGKDVFPQATWAIVDMAQALGMDLQSAAIMVGKALNDPVQGVSALRRVGVSLTKEQEKLVERLVRTGKVAEAQKVILQELNTEFGGSAKAAGETFAGQLDRLKNAFGDIQETIGGAILPVLQQFAEKALQYLGSPEVQDRIQQIAQAIADFAQQVVQWIPRAVEWIRNIVNYLQENRGVVVGILAAIGTAIAAFVYTTVIPAAVATITALAPAIAVMALVGAAAYLLYKAWETNFGGIRDKVAAFIAWLGPVIENVKAWLSVAIPQALQFLRNAWSSVWNAIQAVVNTVFPIILSVYQAFKAAFTGDWYAFGAKLREAWDTLWKLVTQIVQNAWTSIKAAVKNLIDNVINVFKTTDWGAVGRAIIEGIANGISAGAGAIANAAKGAANAALQAAKGFLRIKSPSAVFADEVGYQPVVQSSRQASTYSNPTRSGGMVIQNLQVVYRDTTLRPETLGMALRQLEWLYT
jgi:hypothetical protein